MTNVIANKLTPQREAVNLYHHGTLKWELTPNTIYQTAVRDLQSLEFNSWLRGERGRIKKNMAKIAQITKTFPEAAGTAFLQNMSGKHGHRPRC